MNPTPRHALQAAALLSGLALAAVALLAGVRSLTQPRIAERERDAQLAALSVVMPADRYDNDPLADRIDVIAPAWLGSEDALPAWRARRDGAPSGLILTAVAPDGYAGPIRLLIGVDAEGIVTGVRVTAHQETPGLGDPIEARRSDWIESFRDRSLGDPRLRDWRVAKDGGAFDQFAGATITPRAVVAAVRRALQYVERHGDALYDAPPGSTIEHYDEPADDMSDESGP